MIKYYESMILIKLIDQNHDIRSNRIQKHAIVILNVKKLDVNQI